MGGTPARLSSTLLLALGLGFGPACNCGSSTASGTGKSSTGSNGSGNGSGSSGCGLVTCASMKASCGPVGDGCGNIIQCGECTPPDTCGGGGVDFMCGAGTGSGGSSGSNGSTTSSGGTCTLCPFQVSCGNGKVTSISGTVFAPTDPNNGFGQPDPLPNATVYIANQTPDPFTPGVSCDVCGAPISGNPLVSTTSMLDGGFVLNNVPVDAGFDLVVQLGRWRRVVPIAPVAPCTNTVLTPDQTRLPRNHTEGDIPLTAMVTGSVDSIECVLRKMGVDDAEFTVPGGGGRIEMYLSDDLDTEPGMGGGAGESAPTGVTPPETDLTADAGALGAYDLVIFACIGAEEKRPTAEQTNVINYTSLGGRVYATHYSYVWLYNDQPFEGTADWITQDETQLAGPVNVDVNTGFAKGLELGEWLQIVGASMTPDVIPLGTLRNDFTGVNPPAQNWLTYQPGGGGGVGGGIGGNGGKNGGGNGGSTGTTPWPIHYTFNTPVDIESGPECGRVVFSDFHVENQNSTQGSVFPSACETAPMTAQEKVLEFMLFDLSSCVTQCPPLTCAQLGYTCGQAGDGCGDIINCGGCDAGTCGEGGKAGQCGSPSFE